LLVAFTSFLFSDDYLIEPAGDEFRMNQPWLIAQGG
jgi:hypothetical protein